MLKLQCTYLNVLKSFTELCYPLIIIMWYFAKYTPIFNTFSKSSLSRTPTSYCAHFKFKWTFKTLFYQNANDWIWMKHLFLLWATLLMINLNGIMLIAFLDLLIEIKSKYEILNLKNVYLDYLNQQDQNNEFLSLISQIQSFNLTTRKIFSKAHRLHLLFSFMVEILDFQ